MESAWELFEHQLRSVYEGHRRTAQTLERMADTATNRDLGKLLRELTKEEKEHLGRCEEMFQLIDDANEPEEAGAVEGMIDELKTIRSNNPSPDVLDVAIADVASHLAQHTMSEYETLEKLAQRAGIHQSAPRVGDIMQNTMKELKKASKNLQKVFDQLIEELRPA